MNTVSRVNYSHVSCNACGAPKVTKTGSLTKMWIVYLSTCPLSLYRKVLCHPDGSMIDYPILHGWTEKCDLTGNTFKPNCHVYLCDKCHNEFKQQHAEEQ